MERGGTSVTVAHCTGDFEIKLARNATILEAKAAITVAKGYRSESQKVLAGDSDVPLQDNVELQSLFQLTSDWKLYLVLVDGA